MIKKKKGRKKKERNKKKKKKLKINYLIKAKMCSNQMKIKYKLKK